MRSATIHTPIPTSAKSQTAQLDLDSGSPSGSREQAGVQPLTSVAYDIDEEPDTDDQAAPIEIIQKAGYTIVAASSTQRLECSIRQDACRDDQSILDQLEIIRGISRSSGALSLLHDGAATLARVLLLL